MTCAACKDSVACGIDVSTGKCWTCRFPTRILVLSERQTAYVKAAQASA